MNKILITGSNGLVGKAITEKLLENNNQVIGIGRGENDFTNINNYTHLSRTLDFDTDFMSILLKYKITHVIHLAAIAHLKNKKEVSWDDFYKTNTLMSTKLFEAVAELNIPIFFSSSVDVYGNQDADVLLETMKLNPITNYGKSKMLAEASLINIGQNNSFNYLIARFAPVYSDTSLKDVYKRIYLKYPIISYKIGKGKNYHFLSVNNICDLISFWILNHSNEKLIMNVADFHRVSSYEILTEEKRLNRAKITLKIPMFFISPLKMIISLLYSIVQHPFLNKVDMNLYKLYNPPVYSLELLKKYTNLKWNFINTVYKSK